MSRMFTFALAAALSVTDPTAPLKAVNTKTNQMAVEGAAFDRAFVDQMIKDHQEAVDRIHAEADGSKNPGAPVG